MANVKEIQRRIKSVKNIQQITRAMKMIAAARIKKIERMLKSRRPYCDRIFEIVNEIMSQIDDIHHPLLEIRPVKRIGIVIVTADKGLCGAYNMNVIRNAEHYMNEMDKDKTVVLYCIGTKGYRYFSKRRRLVEKQYVGWTPKDAFAEELAGLFSGEFANGSFDELHCIYTRYITMLSQKVTKERIFPVGRIEEKRKEMNYIFEPAPEEALNIILPKYVKENMMRILLDSMTAELASRINAMSNATDNAEKFVNELKLNYYKARQEQITTEILEIASGAEVMKKG